MFISKESTEIVEIKEEIKVVGLSLQKSGLPITFESLGSLWELYGANYRRQDKIKTVAVPLVEYGVALNTVPDYITGCGVMEIQDLNDVCTSFVIPKGKYIKDQFNAASFESLTGEAIAKRDVGAWAKAHGARIDGLFMVEVYPWDEFDKGHYEMYTLTPIKEKDE